MSKPIKPMIAEMSWEDFRASGAFWFVNRILHVFGLVLVADVGEGDKVDRVYPARTRYRGFPADAEDEGFKKISDYMAANVEELIEEVYDEG